MDSDCTGRCAHVAAEKSARSDMPAQLKRALFNNPKHVRRVATGYDTLGPSESAGDCRQEDLIVGRRGCAGDNPRPAADGRANPCAGRAPDRKRYETPNRRAKASADRPARHDATGGIRVPASLPIVISTVIGRVGDPANLHIITV